MSSSGGQSCRSSLDQSSDSSIACRLGRRKGPLGAPQFQTTPLGSPSLRVLHLRPIPLLLRDERWGLSLVPFLISIFYFPVCICEADSDQPENQQNQRK